MFSCFDCSTDWLLGDGIRCWFSSWHLSRVKPCSLGSLRLVSCLTCLNYYVSISLSHSIFNIKVPQSLNINLWEKIHYWQLFKICSFWCGFSTNEQFYRYVVCYWKRFSKWPEILFSRVICYWPAGIKVTHQTEEAEHIRR